MVARLVITTIALALLVVACSGSDDRVAPAPSPLPAGIPFAGTLTGIVTNERGERLSGLVQITQGTGIGRSVSTNSAGEYTLQAVGPGNVTLRAASKAYTDGFVSVFVNGPATVNFTLQPLPKGVLSGVVSDIDTGRGISGATVRVLRDITTDVVDDWDRTTTTDTSGAYRLENMTLGNTNIAATAPGYQERRTGGNVRVVPTMNLSLRRAPTAETFTGRIGWMVTPECVHPASSTIAQYPCGFQPFTMRRTGAIDVRVSWEGASETAIAVQLLHERFGQVREVRGTVGSGRVIAFSQSTFWTDNWFIRIIDLDNPRLVGTTATSTKIVAYRLTLTRSD